ncbi:MAG: isoleucine--tRNA ligase, partial [Firmicutes bacterium]|nr:isoleucine--tRNA ligase [Candidatus Colimorpha enterica]
ISEFRTACHEFAQNFVDIQMSQFKRLGVLADWEHPYLTMDPKFEAREVKVFGEMFKKGYIYKGLKPVYWCPKDETALAEAEIEYADDPCTSIYVKFKVVDDKGLLDGYDLDNTYFIIWTTTTWTLPGNLAIAVHPRETYAVVSADGKNYIVAEALADKTMQAGGISDYKITKTFKGAELEYMYAQHPFLDRKSVIVNAEYVTMDSGTGCVHTAPGFGADDYVTCKRYNIDIIVPIDDRGYQTEAAGKYAGMYYADSNAVILADLKESGALFASEDVVHSYPHCWRCKNPIIFRATPQWFCSVEAFKDEAVAACDNVNWTPEWGKDRMVQMIRERADWCISRQRHWGLPIPVFYCADCGKPLCDDKTIAKISDIFGEKGSNAWFDLDVNELIPEDYSCPFCGGKSFEKETDTLDGWFDSGSTHFKVLESDPEMKWPADLYLEGADQYRGWFQSSLLTAVAAKGDGAPFKNILTHGWVVDGKGRAMHKSLGNSIAPEEVIVKYGGDLVRLWVASSDYQVDVRVSDDIFKQLSEAYRKIRNTVRILMANLGDGVNDFNPDTDMVAYDELTDIDKWALSRYNSLVKTVRDAYNAYQFHIVYHEINNFCAVDMSKLYIDITKDRLYAEAKDSKLRRAAQTVIYTILSGFLRLTAPIISYTADEAWVMMTHKSDENALNVMLNDMPEYDEKLVFADEESWDKLFDFRDNVMKALEDARNEKLIGKSLDAGVVISTSDDALYATLKKSEKALEDVLVVSAVKVEKGEDKITVTPAAGNKCVRCWKYSENCTADEEGQYLCARCKNVVSFIS